MPFYSHKQLKKLQNVLCLSSSQFLFVSELCRQVLLYNDFLLCYWFCDKIYQNVCEWQLKRKTVVGTKDVAPIKCAATFSIMAVSITTLRIKGLFTLLGMNDKNATQHTNTMCVANMLSVAINLLLCWLSLCWMSWRTIKDERMKH